MLLFFLVAYNTFMPIFGYLLFLCTIFEFILYYEYYF